MGARYRHNDWVGMDLRFDVFNRDTQLPIYRFTNYSVGLTLLLGNRGIALGRLPY